MLSAHRPLMGAQQPALEQTRHVVNMREQRLEGDGGSRHDGDPMVVSFGGQFAVRGPAVGAYHTARFDDAGHKAQHAWLGRIRNAAQAHPTDPFPLCFGGLELDGHRDEGLSVRSSAANPDFFTADVGFVHLHLAREPIPVRADHRPPGLWSHAQAVL